MPRSTRQHKLSVVSGMSEDLLTPASDGRDTLVLSDVINVFSQLKNNLVCLATFSFMVMVAVLMVHVHWWGGVNSVAAAVLFDVTLFLTVAARVIMFCVISLEDELSCTKHLYMARYQDRPTGLVSRVASFVAQCCNCGLPDGDRELLDKCTSWEKEMVSMDVSTADFDRELGLLAHTVVKANRELLEWEQKQSTEQDDIDYVASIKARLTEAEASRHNLEQRLTERSQLRAQGEWVMSSTNT